MSTQQQQPQTFDIKALKEKAQAKGLDSLTPEEILALAKFASRTKKATFKIGHNLSLAVSEKGAVSIYGVGRWPITVYAETLERILASSTEIRNFMQANVSSLTKREEEAG